MREGFTTAVGVKAKGMLVKFWARGHRRRLTGRRAVCGWGRARGWVSWAGEWAEEADTGGVLDGGPIGQRRRFRAILHGVSTCEGGRLVDGGSWNSGTAVHGRRGGAPMAEQEEWK
jgi:hypothetical protein